MFRCTECQKEYNSSKKPEYCECGNDTFEYIEEKPAKQEKAVKQPLSLEQKSKIVSWAFFGLCLLLSLIVWLIPIKTQKEEVKVVEVKPIQKDIPSIDKFWDSTPPKVEKPQVVAEPIAQSGNVIPLNVIPYDNKVAKLVEETAQQRVNTQPKKPVNVSKPVEKQSKKVDVKPIQKTEQKAVKLIKPVQSQTKPIQQQPKPKEQPKSNSGINNQTKPQDIKPVQPKQDVKPVETPPKKVYNPNSPAMLKYKGELRAALFRKLPVGSIQGSGSCAVHFSIDQTGKLINRGFTRQSDNKSLNDAVYYMLMSVPRYSVPPADYSGETINMTIKINNGSYEININ